MTAGLIVAMIVANRLGLRQPAVTAALAFLIWVAVLKSGIHATVAGVIIAGLTPARSIGQQRRVRRGIGTHFWPSIELP